MFGRQAALLALLFASAAASASVTQGSALRNGNVKNAAGAEGFVRALEFKHQLRVCNAYPYAAALDVYRGKSEKLTGDEPMPYKGCKDFVSPLKGGDKLDFRVGDASAGTFSVSELPSNDAVLLLVIHRHDTLSTAVSFESHMFANLENAQVAIIDTYKGTAKATPKIMDAEDFAKANKTSNPRSEELRYDSVVAVNPGRYEVILSGADGEEKAKADFVALNHQSYVVLRTGVEASQGESYPQELVVFPRSDPMKLHSGAAAAAPILGFLAAVVALLA